MRLLILVGSFAFAMGLHAVELTPIEVRQAKDVYVAKCAKCHALPVPANYKDAQWTTWMHKMTKKSRLNPQQADLVTKYTETLRTTPRGVNP